MNYRDYFVLWFLLMWYFMLVKVIFRVVVMRGLYGVYKCKSGGDKYVCVLGWISVDLGWLWGYIRRCKYICVKCNVLYLLCYVKGICELREGYFGVERYERNSVNVFYMGIYVGVWRGFDLK